MINIIIWISCSIIKSYVPIVLYDEIYILAKTFYYQKQSRFLKNRIEEDAGILVTNDSLCLDLAACRRD